MAPSEIRVLPVPHSATTMAVRARCQRLVTPMMAIVCAGKGVRNSLSIRGETRIVELVESRIFLQECAAPIGPHVPACSRRSWKVQAWVGLVAQRAGTKKVAGKG